MVTIRDLTARLPQPTEALEYVTVETDKVNVTAYHRHVGQGEHAEIVLSEYVVPMAPGAGDVWVVGLPPGADAPSAMVLVNRPAPGVAKLVGQLLAPGGSGMAHGNLSVRAGESATGTKGWMVVYPKVSRLNALRQLVGMAPTQTQEFYLANQWGDIGAQAKLPGTLWRAAGMLVKRVADQLTALVSNISHAMEQEPERAPTPEPQPTPTPDMTPERGRE